MDNTIRTADGIWLNVSVFREAAIKFTEYGVYCTHPKDSIDYDDFWDEETKRCMEGFEVGGHKITGHHYFYLNYGIIKKDKGDNSPKVFGLPDFIDADYDFFWALHIARHGCTEEELANLGLGVKPANLKGSQHVILSKARRKGYSFKGAAIAVNTYNTIRGSNTLIVSFAKKYSEDCFKKCLTMIGHLDRHTAWAKKREKTDTKAHIKASFYETVNGVRTELGYMSEISCHTCKDNPDVLRGEDADFILAEESGKNRVFEKMLESSKDCVTSGKYVTGTILAWGTGGSQQADSMDFADLCYNPGKHKFLPFQNQWDDDALPESTCSFFHEDCRGQQGNYDKNGNSDRETAMAEELAEWERLKKVPNGGAAVTARMAEHPLQLKHSFIIKDSGDFPVQELQAHLNRIKANSKFLNLGMACDVYESEGKVIVKPDLMGKLTPIYSYVNVPENKKGAVVVYEHPLEGAPKGLYKIGVDNYRHDQSGGSSLGCIVVYKSTNKFSPTGDKIVAIYVGRPATTDDFDRLVLLLCRYYDALAMVENEVQTTFKYFARKKSMHYLALRPQSIIDAATANSKTNLRKYGCPMTKKLKDDGEKYLKKWLLTHRDTDTEGRQVLNLEEIYDVGLLEELIRYNREGNFDRVMALMMVVLFIEDEDLEVFEDLSPKSEVGAQLAARMLDRYSKTLSF